jgi:hypothetical protein
VKCAVWADGWSFKYSGSSGHVIDWLLIGEGIAKNCQTETFIF